MAHHELKMTLWQTRGEGELPLWAWQGGNVNNNVRCRVHSETERGRKYERERERRKELPELCAWRHFKANRVEWKTVLSLCPVPVLVSVCS